jgi:O-antigen ligase
VYFIVLGIQTSRGAWRIGSWLGAFTSVYIVGLTVSRGKLLALGVATVIALRHVLRRGFVPVLLVVICAWIGYSLGLFDRITGYYLARGTEETGRLVVWPLALQRFLNNPLFGLGASQIATVVPTSDHPVAPHNGFLYIGLASGIIPLAFFLAYWLHAGFQAYRASAAPIGEAPYLAPMFAYAFLVMCIGNGTFMYSWMIVALAAPLTAGNSRLLPGRAINRLRMNTRRRQLGVRFIARRSPAGHC